MFQTVLIERRTGKFSYDIICFLLKMSSVICHLSSVDSFECFISILNQFDIETLLSKAIYDG